MLGVRLSPRLPSFDSTVDHGYTLFLEWQEKEREENLEKVLQ